MKDFFLVLRLRRTLLKNALQDDLQNHSLKWVLLTVLALFFVVGDFAFFYRILSYMHDLPLNVGDILVPHLLNIVFLTFFSMLLFSSVITSISTFFLSSDLELLVATPIQSKTLFISKFIETTINASWMLLLFGLPILVAYGFVFKASPVYYFLLPLILLPFLVIPSGIGITFTVLLMNFFPAKKTHQIFMMLGIFFAVGLIMYIRFLKPEILLGKDVPDTLILQFIEGLKVPDDPFLPSNWITNTILLSVSELSGKLFLYLFLLWIVALSVFILSLETAGKVYYRAWTGQYTSLIFVIFH